MSKTTNILTDVTIVLVELFMLWLFKLFIVFFRLQFTNTSSTKKQPLSPFPGCQLGSGANTCTDGLFQAVTLQKNNYSVTVNTVANSIALEELPAIIEKFPGSITG